MILALFAFGLVLLALPGVVRRPPRRLPAGEWAPVAVVSLLAGAAAVLTGLALAAVPAVSTLFGVPGIADHCRTALAPLATDPTFLSWLAGAAAIVVAARSLLFGARATTGARRARIEPWLGEHTQRGEFELVVVPTDRLLAFGVPGRSPQVVISAGLTRRLERDELEAVVVHEAAHLRLRHATVLSILLGIGAGFSVIPIVGRSIEAVRAALEVWADAAVPGSRSATHNPLRRALVDMTTANRCTTPNVDTETNDRVHRLARRARPQPVLLRAAVYTPVAMLVLTAAALVAGWFTDAHHAVALGQPCTH